MKNIKRERDKAGLFLSGGALFGQNLKLGKIQGPEVGHSPQQGGQLLVRLINKSRGYYTLSVNLEIFVENPLFL